MSKSSVSALHEFCAKKHIPAPEYEFIDSEEGISFVCRARVLNMEAEAGGRSKRDAKHLAASNLSKILRRDYPDIEDIPQVEHKEIPTTDMVVTLRDYCVQKNHPLPSFEIVQQGGTPDAPEFITKCVLASIIRYGTSEKKKDAKQKAALAMFEIISENNDLLEHELQVASIDAKADEVEYERYYKFKSYRELTESTIGETSPGILLTDRHNYFTKFHDHLKKQALAVLSDPLYVEDYEMQVHNLFKALKITPRITKVAGVKSVEKIVQVEMNCDFDAFFSDVESRIFKYITEYFRDMLI